MDAFFHQDWASPCFSHLVQTQFPSVPQRRVSSGETAFSTGFSTGLSTGFSIPAHTTGQVAATTTTTTATTDSLSDNKEIFPMLSDDEPVTYVHDTD